MPLLLYDYFLHYRHPIEQDLAHMLVVVLRRYPRLQAVHVVRVDGQSRQFVSVHVLHVESGYK